jgi:hypothetical protein
MCTVRLGIWYGDVERADKARERERERLGECQHALARKEIMEQAIPNPNNFIPQPAKSL